MREVHECPCDTCDEAYREHNRRKAERSRERRRKIRESGIEAEAQALSCRVRLAADDRFRLQDLDGVDFEVYYIEYEVAPAVEGGHAKTAFACDRLGEPRRAFTTFGLGALGWPSHLPMPPKWFRFLVTDKIRKRT